MTPHSPTLDEIFPVLIGSRDNSKSGKLLRRPSVDDLTSRREDALQDHDVDRARQSCSLPPVPH